MRAYLQGYLHGQNDGYHSTLIENKMMDESYDGNLNVEYAPIDQVLEIIEAEMDEVNCIEPKYWLRLNKMRGKILDLKGGEQE